MTLFAISTDLALLMRAVISIGICAKGHAPIDGGHSLKGSPVQPSILEDASNCRD